jgi:deazaflavin-dependent oxidoreductase (nitroreductase family)
MRRRPGAIAQRLYRAPEWLYERGLGWLLGRRFLLLHHTGRRTGLPRRTVLEVMRYDAAADRHLAASAYGEGADWFQNVLANPAVEIQVGRERLRRRARRVAAEETERELLDYARRHPLAFRVLGWVLGHETKRSEGSLHALAALMPVVAFGMPQDPGGPLSGRPVDC